eukprot:3049011-Rhodomonas_salina.3
MSRVWGNQRWPPTGSNTDPYAQDSSYVFTSSCESLSSSFLHVVVVVEQQPTKLDEQLVN